MPVDPRPLLFKLHLYVSVAAGLWIAVLGITGAIIAFATEIDHLQHAKFAYVKPAPPRLDLAALGEAVARAYPGQRITAYNLGGSPDLATTVRAGSTIVYVNPYTGDILGTRAPGVSAIDLANSIHRRLVPQGFEGGPTQTFLSWITVAALFLVLSGIWLWWPSKRFGIREHGGRRFWFDVHATLGITAAAFLILLTLSGIIMGFGRTTTPILYALTKSQPASRPQIPPPPTDGSEPIPIDNAFAIAGDALPGAALVTITGPANGLYVASARAPGDHTANGASFTMIDAYTGDVLFKQFPGTIPGGTRLSLLIRSIHTGEIFGSPTKALMALASVLIVLQIVSGVAMWINRVSVRRMIPALGGAVAVTLIAVCAASPVTRAAVARQFVTSKPDPERAALFRRYLARETDEDAAAYMAPSLIASSRQQAAIGMMLRARFGKFQSLAFQGVDGEGNDLYIAAYERGYMSWTVAPLTVDHKLERLVGTPLR